MVPPPMCSFELQLASPANQVTFLSKALRAERLAVLTSDGHVSVFAEGGSPSGASGSSLITQKGGKVTPVRLLWPHVILRS